MNKDSEQTNNESAVPSEYVRQHNPGENHHSRSDRGRIGAPVNGDEHE